MDKLSIAEIARTVGVAQSTVSRALNNSGYVAPETRERIAKAIEFMGYRRNSIARNLRSRSSYFIGLVIPDIANAFFSNLAKVLETGLRREGYALLLCNTEESEEIEEFYINSLLDTQVAAIVLTSSSLRFSQTIRSALVPVVLADRYIDDKSFELFSCVTSDNEQGGQGAIETLFARGATNLLVIGDELHVYVTEKRVNAALARAVSLGLPAETCYVQVSPRGGYEAIVSALKRNVTFDAVFCATDTLAFGALHALNEHGVSVPGDVQIIGFDGTELGAYSNPSLTSYRQDVAGIGEAIKNTVINLIDHKPVERLIQLPVQLIERETTRRL